MPSSLHFQALTTLLLGLVACAGRPLESSPAEPRLAPERATPALAPADSIVPAAELEAAVEPQPTVGPEAAACPNGMAHVVFSHCPKVARRCLDKEYDKAWGGFEKGKLDPGLRRDDK